VSLNQLQFLLLARQLCQSEPISPVSLSLIRPAYRSSHDYIHVKNGIMDLPPAGKTFQCLVGNFSDNPLTLRKNQVVGVAEGQYITIFTPLASGAETDQLEWEGTLKQKLSHISP
jgi:hypothetical protein